MNGKNKRINTASHKVHPTMFPQLPLTSSLFSFSSGPPHCSLCLVLSESFDGFTTKAICTNMDSESLMCWSTGSMFCMSWPSHRERERETYSVKYNETLQAISCFHIWNDWGCIIKTTSTKFIVLNLTDGIKFRVSILFLSIIIFLLSNSPKLVQGNWSATHHVFVYITFTQWRDRSNQHNALF